MDSKGAIYAFINYKQAAQFGHVGWGFQLDSDNYYFGSTDHLWKHDWWDLPAWFRYMHVPPYGDIDWWAEQGSKADMLKMMKIGPHIRYHDYKEVSLTESSPETALSFTEQLQTSGWNLAKHNCVHQAFLIFSNYNNKHELPNPFQDPLNLIPKNWFARISGEPKAL